MSERKFFQDKSILAGLTAGIMGMHSHTDEVSGHQHAPAESVQSQAEDISPQETQEDKELRVIARFVSDAQKKIEDEYAHGKHEDARKHFSDALNHLHTLYQHPNVKHSGAFRVSLLQHIYNLYIFEGGYCVDHPQTIVLYSAGMTINPRLAIDIASLHHEDGEENARIAILREGYEKSQSTPDWHIKFDIGEELALALGLNGKSGEALHIYRELFDTYQKLIEQHAIAVDQHLQTIYQAGDFIKMEPYVDTESFNKYSEYRKQTFAGAAKGLHE